MGWKCGLEVWLPAFQLPRFAKCDTAGGYMFRAEICSKSLFKASIPAILFGNFRHPLPARSFMFLRAAAHSTSSALCLHYACERSHPLVEDSGFVSHAEKHRFGHGVVVSKVCYRILECVFSHSPCRLWKCVGIELLATVEVGLPAS